MTDVMKLGVYDETTKRLLRTHEIQIVAGVTQYPLPEPVVPGEIVFCVMPGRASVGPVMSNGTFTSVHLPPQRE